MTTNLSGTYQLDLTANDIIGEALEILQAKGTGEDVDGNVYTQAKNALNMLLKLWEAQGIHLWTDEEYTLFFTVGQRIYDLAASATKCVNGEDWVSAQLAADVAIAATTITVDDDSELALGWVIGILDTSNDLTWNIIEALPGSDVVNLRNAVTAAASENAYVRAYAPKKLGTTTLAVQAVATDTVVEVASIVGLEADMQIGITDDTGAVLWTTVNSIDADLDEITLNTQITATSSIGVDVIFYSAEQNFIPFSRLPNTGSMRRHSGEASDYEIPIQLQSRQDYMQLPNKEQQGTVIQSYYSRQEPAGKLYVWNAPSSAVEYLNFTAEREIQIIVDSDDTFDLPVEWYLALSYNLAKLLIPKIGCSPERQQLIRADAADYLDLVLSFDSDIYGLRMVPELDYG